MKSRDYYFQLLKANVHNPKMIAHSLASEAVMRALAERLEDEKDLWGIAGLLHDIDVELTAGDSCRHGLEGAKMLQNEDLPEEVLDAIIMHNEKASGKERTTKFQHALAAGETITGFIFAIALVYPDKKISSVKVKSVVKRMKEKIFAASVKRENIRECECLGLQLEEFVELSLNALSPIESELGF